MLASWGRLMIDKYRELDLNLFIVFDALLTHGSVSRAARELGRSQSAISHALGRLRAYFGDELFVKTQEGVMPTERATELADAVRAFVAHADSALLRSVPFVPQSSQRAINLGLGDTVELTMLPSLLSALRAEAPGCSIDSRSYTREGMEQALASGTVDLVLGVPVPLSANILQQKLCEFRFSVIVAPDCPLQGSITPQQFSRQREIIILPMATDRHRLAEALDAAGIRRNVAVRTHHALIVPHLVGSSSEYIAIVPEPVAQVYQERFNLRIVETEFQLPSFSVCQFFHRRAKTDPFNMWLRRLIQRIFSQQAYSHHAHSRVERGAGVSCVADL